MHKKFVLRTSNFVLMNVIITGASKGIGKAIAEIFAANGHNLFLSSRGEVHLYKTMEELCTRFPSVSIKAKALSAVFFIKVIGDLKFKILKDKGAPSCGGAITINLLIKSVLVS